ncbi:MAG: DUF2484 family protein [Pseudomonadota bacterium]
MPLPLILVCLWIVLASVLGALPTKDSHWTRAYWLMAILACIFAYAAYEGAWAAILVGLIAACFIFRWPLWYLWKWVKQKAGQ